MPLTPSPVISQDLQHTQQTVRLMRWLEDDELPQAQRSVLVGNTEMDDGSFRAVPLNSIELICAEEAYELAQAILDQVEFLSHITKPEELESEPERANWVVSVTETTEEGTNTRIHGPMTRFACDCWADMEIQTNQRLLSCAVTRLQRPPLV